MSEHIIVTQVTGKAACGVGDLLLVLNRAILIEKQQPQGTAALTTVIQCAVKIMGDIADLMLTRDLRKYRWVEENKCGYE